MSDAKQHTPGPWRHGVLFESIVADADTGFDHIDTIDAYGGNLVAESIRMDANKNLISAAPELLEALTECREACLVGDDDGITVSEDVVITSDLFGKICAAINKARGKS